MRFALPAVQQDLSTRCATWACRSSTSSTARRICSKPPPRRRRRGRRLLAHVARSGRPRASTPLRAAGQPRSGRAVRRCRERSASRDRRPGPRRRPPGHIFNLVTEFCPTRRSRRSSADRGRARRATERAVRASDDVRLRRSRCSSATTARARATPRTRPRSSSRRASATSSYRGRLARANAARDEPLSLYVHLPFCEERCAVLRLQRRDHAGTATSRATTSTTSSARSTCSRRARRRRRVAQFHWGGGTPTYFTRRRAARLHDAVADTSTFKPDAEIGDRGRPARHHARAARDAARARLQPPVDGRPGLRRRRCRRRSTASRPRADARADRRRARAPGFALDQRRPDLRPAAPDRRRFQRTLDSRSSCGPTASPPIPTPTCRGSSRTRSDLDRRGAADAG